MTDRTERQSTPSIREFVERRIDERLDGLRVSLPARVSAYDKDRQRLEAQPLVHQAHIDAEGRRIVKPLPTCSDVPIVWPGRVTFPIEVGDVVLLSFASSSIARVKLTGKGGDPGDDRHHRLSDAIAIPGLSVGEPSLDATEDAYVVHESDIRLGGPAAEERVAWHSAIVALKDVLSTWEPVTGDGGATLKVLLTALIESGWPHGSTKVKAE